VNRASSRISRGTTFDEVDFTANFPHHHHHHNNVTQPHAQEFGVEKPRKISETALFQPLVMQFTVIVEVSSIVVGCIGPVMSIWSCYSYVLF